MTLNHIQSSFRGGLADQLGRVQARDKSAVRIWNHQQNKPSLSQGTSAISFKKKSKSFLIKRTLNTLNCLYH